MSDTGPSTSIDLGVCIASKIDDIDEAVLAEQLGFSHVWVADSQMIWSDCYAVMALIADRTSRIRIGTGVAVAGTRPAAVTAAAHATINRIAPGRVFCGVGTGNTAMRIMGHKPIGLAEFDDYLRTLRLLLDGLRPMCTGAARSPRPATSCPTTGSSRSAPECRCTSPPSALNRCRLPPAAVTGS